MFPVYSLRTIRLPRLGLPLLARELTEMANRRRTYVLRVVYGVLLFFLAFLQFYDLMRYDSSQFALVGHGRRMFETLVTLQFGGIYLFMPVIGCSAITQEKEQNTLPLLLLTRLGPMTILLEKLLSRLVPMFVFQMLAMPLLAFAYSLGGVSELQLWGTIAVLAMTAVHAASITLMCSAYCRSTVSAFLSSYAFAAGSFFFCSCCGMAYAFRGGGLSVTTDEDLVVRLFLLGGSSLFFILLARSYLLMRHVIATGQEFGESLPRHERVETRSEPVVVKSEAGTSVDWKTVYVWQGHSLPDEYPVAWRALARRSNQTLKAVIFTMEFAVGLLLLPATISFIAGGQISFFHEFLEVVLWIIAVLLIIVSTSGTIARERSRQTLDVLLTTPLSGRGIVTQKLRPAWRLVLLLWIPFGTLLLFRGLFWVTGGLTESEAMGLLAAGLSLLVYLPLLVWICAWIGMRVRTQGRAIAITLGVVIVWMLLPVLLPLPERMPDSYRIEILSWLTLSPLAMFLGHSVDRVTTAVSLMLFLALLHGLLLAGIRHHVLRRADVWLGRVGEGEEAPLTAGAGIPLWNAEGPST